jgi:hypothetical protein
MEIYIYDKRLWLREHGFLIDTRTDYPEILDGIYTGTNLDRSLNLPSMISCARIT